MITDKEIETAQQALTDISWGRDLSKRMNNLYNVELKFGDGCADVTIKSDKLLFSTLKSHIESFIKDHEDNLTRQLKKDQLV